MPDHAEPVTKDRFSPEMMERLVAGPIGHVRSGDLDAGERAFATLLAGRRERSGRDSLEVADTFTAFGVLLYSRGLDIGDDRLRRASVGYLRQAVPVYRAVFGDVHPEVALALSSYADVERGLDPDDPPPTVDRSIEEAYRIRLAALGRDNPETLSTAFALAEVKALPSRVRSDERRLAEVAPLFDEIISLPHDDAALAHFEGPIRASFALALAYLDNGRFDLAMRQSAIARSSYRAAASRSREICANLAFNALMFANRLEAKGYPDESEELAADFRPALLSADIVGLPPRLAPAPGSSARGCSAAGS